MKISTKGRYALRMFLDLAQHKGDGFVALRDIAERQGISKKYLEQIVSLLRTTDMLRTNRGYQGGYMLTREAYQYTVAEILRLTEGSLSPVSCMADQPNQCERCDTCMTLPIWQGLEKVIDDYLSSITLQDILDRNNDRGADEYSI